jgi:signal transduction histidine kinase
MAPADAELPRAYCGRPVAIAMLLVVASFSVTLAISQWRLQPIETLALEITQDAAPGIERLTSLRTELLRLDMAVNQYLTRTDGIRTVSREDIDTVRHRLDSDLSALRRLPTGPEESVQLKVIEAEIAHLDQAMTGALDEAQVFSPMPEKAVLYAAFHGHVLQVEDALLRLTAVNERDARARSDGILRSRRGALTVATALGIVSWVVAVFASLLVMRVLRGHDRLLREHSRLIAKRAAELEAFAGRVAHDLKNPLGAMAMRVLAITRRPDHDPAIPEDLKKLTYQVHRMDKIVDGMLEFARSGADPTAGARADLHPILDEVLEELRSAIEAAGIEIEVALFPPTQLACTPAALTSVLSNLLGNAVKYSAGGTARPPRISVCVKDLGDDQSDGVRIEIADNGPGLPSGAEQIIFEPFRRLSEQHQPGIGLGLATVKKLVEAYKGRVGAISRQGRGSVFWVELPKPPFSPQAETNGRSRPTISAIS